MVIDQNGLNAGIWEHMQGVNACTTIEKILETFKFDKALALPPDDEVDPCPYTDASDFLHGSCNLFAKMLHQQFGYEVHEISCENGCHWFCVTEYKEQTVFIDVRGATTNKELFFKPFKDIVSSPSFRDEVQREDTMEFEDEPWRDTGLLFALQIIIDHKEFYRIYNI